MMSSQSKGQKSQGQLRGLTRWQYLVEKLILPSRYKITTKQQPKGIRMIVENHDMLDCFAAYGYQLRLDREDFLFCSRRGIRQPVGSNHHHSFSRFRMPIFQEI